MNTGPDHFLSVAYQTVADMPAAFLPAAREVLIRVEEWPGAEMLQSLGIRDPRDLTGLYEGIPMPAKSISYPAPYPDCVWLFRQPILAEWRGRGDVALDDLIAHVTVHEFAHHFGWSDDEIAAIDPWWE